MSEPTTTAEIADALAPVLQPLSVPVPGTEPKPAPAQPEAAPAKADQEGSTDEVANKEDEPKRNSAKARISELYGEKKAAERRADHAIQKAQELQRQLEEIQRTTDPNDWQQQQRADVRSAVKEESLEAAKQEVHDNITRAKELRMTAFEAKIEAARERMPDLDEVMKSFGALPVSETAADIISESEKAAEISYFLAKNPDDARRIASLPPHRQAYELAKIEAKVSPAVPRRTSNAPPPVPMIGGGSSPSSPALKDMSVSQIAQELGYGR